MRRPLRQVAVVRRHSLTYRDGFDQFWAAYPRKRKRLDALKAYEQARRDGVTLDTMLAALDWQRHQSQWVRDGGQYIPYPASWIRAGSYDDEPDEPIARVVERRSCPHDPRCNSQSWCLTRTQREAEGWERNDATGEWSKKREAS